MPRRTRTIATALAGVAAAGLLVALVPGSAAAQTSAAESVEHAPTACRQRPNDTLHDLLECVTISGVRAHQEAFQRIADNNGDTRASGTPGYDRSVSYVVKKLRDAGYSPSVQAFDFPYFIQLTPAVFEQTAPTARTFVEDTDFATMEFSGSGDVTAPITPVDLLLPPVGGSTSGCEPADFAGFPAGNVALIQRGTCTFGDKAFNAEDAGASAVIIFNEGNSSPDRTELLFGTLGRAGHQHPGARHQLPARRRPVEPAGHGAYRHRHVR